MLRYSPVLSSVLRFTVLAPAGLGLPPNTANKIDSESCGVVMQEILDIPENIPQELQAEGRVRHHLSLRWRRSRWASAAATVAARWSADRVRHSTVALGRTGDALARRRQRLRSWAVNLTDVDVPLSMNSPRGRRYSQQG